MIWLRAGGLEAALSPAVGGSLRSLALDGVDLLRRAPECAADPLAMASFPLVPYANRIAEGRFAFDGREYKLPLNFGDHPHSIHGFGWQRAWTASETGETSVSLVHAHGGDAGWPWAYRAQQHVALTPDRLSMSLFVTNVGDHAMPVGLGFHPYFLTDEGTRLQFGAQGLWLSTPDMLPDQIVPADALGNWSHGAPVPGDGLIDNAYTGWDGRAIVQRGDGLRLTLRSADAPFLHVYRPPGLDFLCLEPVSHMPDAINRDGMATLAPGAVTGLSMTIAIDRIDPALP